MRNDTVVHSLPCPASDEPALVELRLSRLQTLQLAAPRVVSCSHREQADECGLCCHQDLSATEAR